MFGRSGPERRASHIARLYASSGAERWGVSAGEFAEALEASVRHRWGGAVAPDRDVARYLDGLALGDLAIACGCRAGSEGAWEHFVREYRPVLYAAARAIAGDGGRELADGLYADLFGLDAARPDRRSLFAYYHGRSSLATWLRAVLVRRHIDRMRAGGRHEPLVDEDERLPGPSSMSGADAEERARLVAAAQAALDRAVAELAPAERLRLRLYYGNELTLAAIGRLLHEHEATVSRKLDKARRGLRERVEAILREEHGFADALVHRCFELAADAPELHLTRLLTPQEGA